MASRLRSAPRARAHATRTCVALLAIAGAFGCGGESHARDSGFVFEDMARPDLGRDAGSGTDARIDAPTSPDAGDAEVDAGRDAGRDMSMSMTCESDRDCPRGQRCIDGACTGGGDCCDLIECRPPATCDPFSCSCFATGGCCDTGFCPDPSSFCDFGTCECIVSVCTPECEDGFICDFGTCYPPCIFGTPCPAGEICSFELGCVTPQCVADECESMSPPMRCDPTVGCMPTCVGDFSWCTTSGGRCFLDQCIDDSCGERDGMVPRFCGYTFDCCGNAICQHVDEPDPPCPVVCPTPTPPPPTRPDLCACSLGFGGPTFCTDLRSGGFFPGPRPVPEPGPPPPID